jgi:hypothetical protein
LLPSFSLPHKIVHVLYCSGDLHAGNVTRPYDDNKGVPVQQKGYFNTKAAVDWALENMQAELTSFVVSDW